MALPLSALEELPGIYGGTGAAFRDASRELAASSALLLPDAVLPGAWALRSAEVATRFHVTLEQRRLLFGFAGRTRNPEVLLECSVGFRVEPEIEPPSRPPLRPNGILHRVLMPPVLARKPLDSDQRLAAAACGVAPGKVEFLRLDGSWLAVTEGDMQSVQMAWRPDHNLEWQPVITATAGSNARSWQVPPFLALARTMGRWIRGLDPPVAQTITAAPPPDPEKIEASLFVLGVIASAWAEGVNEIEQRNDFAAIPPGDRVPSYTISGYRAEVRLLVDGSGRLVRKQGHPNALQLRAKLEAGEEEAGVPRTTITIEPPDFLAAGGLYEAFLDQLRKPEVLARIAEQLGFTGQGEAVGRLIDFARRSTAGAPLVFRVRRGRPDTNLIVLNGLFLDRSIHLVLRAAFEVDAAQGKVEVDTRSVEPLLTFPPLDPGREPLSRQPEVLTESFFRLVRLLIDWRNALS